MRKCRSFYEKVFLEQTLPFRDYIRYTFDEIIISLQQLMPFSLNALQSCSSKDVIVPIL